MATRASSKAPSTVESLVVLAVAGVALWYERTILADAAWQEIVTRYPVVGQHPRLALAGAVVGLVALLSLVGFISYRCKILLSRTETKPLQMVSADTLASFKGTGEAQSIDGLTARGRLTAITALPKQGKTYAWMGLLKARQEGGTWFGRRCERGRTCVLTEEDRGTFSAKVKQFGIRGETLVTIHAPETADGWFGPEAWEGFIFDAARRAKRAGCDTLCVDTGTTWCPWMFRGPEAMSQCLRTFKRAVVAHRLAGVMILHNRKQGSDLGAVVEMLGTIAGSAAYDVVAGFKRERETGECTLAVDGRLGEWECTARLVDGRYVPVGELARMDAPPPARPAPAPPMAGVVDVLVRAGAGGLTRDAIQQQTGIAAATLQRYLAALTEEGHLTREGQGIRGDPHVWRAVALPPAPPTADPEYVRYLGSEAWAEKRRAVLERCELRCEDCGAVVEASELEVHHLPEAYRLIPQEPLSLLVGCCPGCHRRRHALPGHATPAA